LYNGVVDVETAFILLNIEVGSDQNIIDDLSKIPEVIQAYNVYGVHDVIIQIQAESVAELKDIIAYKIRRIDNITSTLTMIVSD